MAKTKSNSKVVKKVAPVKKVKKKAAKHIRPKTKEPVKVKDPTTIMLTKENGGWTVAATRVSIYDVLSAVEALTYSIKDQMLNEHFN